MTSAATAFQSFMNSFSLADAAVLLVFFPLLTLVHELGHATVPLARTEGFVLVQVGREPGRWQLRFGRLLVRVDPRPSSTKAAGYARVAARLSPRERATLAVAGPAAGALFSLAVVTVGRSTGVPIVEVAGWLGFVSSLANLVPHRAGQLRSDGWHLLQALAGHGTGQSDVQDNAARVEVLLADAARRLPEERQLLLGGAPVSLGFAPDDRGPEALELWRVAFVGWCWRECERGPLSVREAALDALHEATRGGAFGPSLSGHAARILAQSDADFGEVFDGGFAHARDRPDGRERFAFRFGGALREIERIRS